MRTNTGLQLLKEINMLSTAQHIYERVNVSARHEHCSSRQHQLWRFGKHSSAHQYRSSRYLSEEPPEHIACLPLIL